MITKKITMYAASLAALGVASIGGIAVAEDAASRTVWEGVYAAEQAEAGLSVYATQCQQCHAETMRGGPGAPGLVGPGFQFGWDEKTVGELFAFIKENMPAGAAGSLTDQQYIDVTAAILQENGFPAGEAALQPESEALDQILITREKPGQ